jgi:hypothetical protein
MAQICQEILEFAQRKKSAKKYFIKPASYSSTEVGLQTMYVKVAAGKGLVSRDNSLFTFLKQINIFDGAPS